jgi:Ca-activated chloride channel family protein
MSDMSRKEAIENLEAHGSTNGSAGINTAYEIAETYFKKGGNNRVILATDGDLNVGVTSEDGLTELITEKKESGIYLSVLGFGTDNLKDNKL